MSWPSSCPDSSRAMRSSTRPGRTGGRCPTSSTSRRAGAWPRMCARCCSVSGSSHCSAPSARAPPTPPNGGRRPTIRSTSTAGSRSAAWPGSCASPAPSRLASTRLLSFRCAATLTSTWAGARLGAFRDKAARRLCPNLAALVEGRCAASRQGLHEVADMIERVGVTPDRARPLLRQLRTLADADVCWDEVVSIERTPPPEPWVYDLTIDDTHNFVAANVIVHNSNISEAVRWALGEQSAKSLRGQRMEDLIFHGTGARKPIGLAEVELTFSNEGTLSVPWSEIAVARRLYRTGESEYLLNKQPTRLRDILDMFAGTGANPRAYSVMDQDKLNHVLTAKPHERRVFIEEAAGIARYKQQRSETQGKLDAARQNLVRVRDVMDEVKRQLGSLERQARKAQQYKTLQSEKRELALALVAADWAGLTAESGRR